MRWVSGRTRGAIAKLQSREVIVPVDASVKVTERGLYAETTFAEKPATGPTKPGRRKEIASSLVRRGPYCTHTGARQSLCCSGSDCIVVQGAVRLRYWKTMVPFS